MTTDVSRRNISLVDQIRAEATRHHLEIIPTAKEYGTLEALEEIDSPSEVKLALIVGGATTRDYSRVRTVTSLAKEHLHLMIKPEFAEKGIEALHRKHIFLGPPTTASHHVARDVLDFLGLRPTTEDKSRGYIIDPAPREQTLRELTRIESLGEPARTEAIARLPLILVAQDDADPEAVSFLLETIYDTPLANAIRPPALNEQVNAFPRHAGTERYLHRNDPLLTPEAASKLTRFAGGIVYFLSGAIALYGFFRLRSIRRFESYYREIGQIEMIGRGLENDPAAPTDVASLQAHLEGRLTTLKCKVLKDFAEGGLRGEGLMAGIIALINDTRESLAGMVTARNGSRRSPAPDQLDPPVQGPGG